MWNIKDGGKKRADALRDLTRDFCLDAAIILEANTERKTNVTTLKNGAYRNDIIEALGDFDLRDGITHRGPKSMRCALIGVRGQLKLNGDSYAISQGFVGCSVRAGHMDFELVAAHPHWRGRVDRIRIALEKLVNLRTPAVVAGDFNFNLGSFPCPVSRSKGDVNQLSRLADWACRARLAKVTEFNFTWPNSKTGMPSSPVELPDSCFSTYCNGKRIARFDYALTAPGCGIQPSKFEHGGCASFHDHRPVIVSLNVPTD